MIKNYLKTAIRFISRNKLFSTINILGLALGMACFILIFLWVNDELSYDKYHKNADSIYRVLMEKEENGTYEKIARTPPPLSNTLKNEFPEIKNASRIFYFDFDFEKDINIYPESGIFVDNDFFTMFDIEFLSGDTATFFSSKYNILLSRKVAEKIFGTVDVVGKTIGIESTPTTIAGVFENIPNNSHFKYDFLVCFDILYEFGLPRDMWDNYNNPMYTYVNVMETTNINDLNDKISGTIKHNNPNLSLSPFLQPLTEIYLKSNFSGDIPQLGNMKNIYIFSIISIFILLIAGFNFMNLTTAQSTSRLKEIGVRKILGSNRKSIINQFLGEALLIAFMAHIFAVIIVELLLPVFNNLTLKELSISYFNYEFLILISLMTLIVGFFSGSYPALYLSRFKPINLIKGNSNQNDNSNFIRKALVIFQFSISISLIIGSIVIRNQIKFIDNKDLGFNKSEILYIPLPSNGDYKVLKENLKNNSSIKNITVLSHKLTDVVHLDQVSWEGKDESIEVLMNMLWVDEDFISTMDMKIIKGSDFLFKNNKDTIPSFILNEAAINQLGFEDPIGKKFKIGRWEGLISGVVKNFHFQPLSNDIKPMVLSTLNFERNYLYIRINNLEKEKIISFIENEFKKFAPDSFFNYFFLDDSIGRMYKNENRLASLSNYSTFLTIIISCLGLFGLISFMAERRTKEIGVRKVLGASILKIVYVMSKQIILWVLIANIISWPITYYYLSTWLDTFSYKIELNIWTFIFGGLLTLIIAFLTVSIKSLHAAQTNPINALRHE